MRIRRGLIAVCTCLMLGMIGCSPGDRVDVDTAISEVTIGMSEQEVRDTLGEPGDFYWGSTDGVEWQDFRYKDVDDKDSAVLVSMVEGVVTEVKKEKRVDGEWPDNRHTF